MIEELKPCPFCGSTGNYLDHTEDGYPDCHEIACSNATCTYVISNKSTKALAHAAWNTRCIPEGCALVPREPTEHMLRAALTNTDDSLIGIREILVDAYKAMVAAAPGAVEAQ